MDQTAANATTQAQASNPVSSPEPPVSKPATQEAKPPAPARPKEDNVVFVGKKGVMGYVLAVVTAFNKGFPEVTIKARGHLISRAVDVEEVVKHSFIPGIKVKDIRIMTENLQSRDGHPSKVSAIEIVLSK